LTNSESVNKCRIKTRHILPHAVNCGNGTETEWYGDGAGNTVEENSSIFSLIQMR